MQRTATGVISALAVLAAWAFAAASASAQDGAPRVSDVRLGGDGQSTRVVIDSDRPLDYFFFSLADQGARIVIDLEKVEFELDGRPIGGGQYAGPGRGLVAGFRYADPNASTSRVVLDLAAPARVRRDFRLEPEAERPSHRIVLDLEPADAAEFQANAGYPSDQPIRVAVRQDPPQAPAPTPAPQRPRRNEILVVVDAGHGGHDAGASAGGVREADVNLATARAVRDALEADGRYRVVMTREDDRFVELEDRVDLARALGADLFLSIHADSGPSHLHGAAVYTLADRAEGRRAEVLRHNPRILNVDLSSRGSDVSEIIVDLVHRDTKNQATRMADQLVEEVAPLTGLLSNPHRSENIYVLITPDVPSVLLETGFLTNAADRARLTSSRERARLADAIVSGINSYFDRRERLYAARGTR